MLIFQNTIEKNLFLFKFIQISTVPYIHIRNNSNNFREYPLWIIIQKYQNQISTYSKQFLFQIPNSFYLYSITSYLYKPFFQTLKPLINIRSDSRAPLSLLARIILPNFHGIYCFSHRIGESIGIHRYQPKVSIQVLTVATVRKVSRVCYVPWT